MGVVSDWLMRRKVKKLMSGFTDFAEQAEQEAVKFSNAVKASAWFRRFGDYPVSVQWLEFAELPHSIALESFPSTLEALLFMNELERSRFPNSYRTLNEDALTDSEKLMITWSSACTGNVLGVFTFLSNFVAEGEAKDRAESSARDAEELRYLREDADEVYFREAYIEIHEMFTGEPLELSEDELAAVLANPRIAHLAPKQ